MLTWVHLFSPHEPYENHPEFSFGERDLDRYDSEIRFADETVGALVEEDDTLMILESMKMEIPITTPTSGVVKEILVAEGDVVQEGQTVAIVE